MSSFEYNDLFLNCQETGKYHMFIFDIVNSQKMTPIYRKIAQEKMIKLMKKIYGTISNIEKLTNKKILVFEDDFVSYDSDKTYKGFGIQFQQRQFIIYMKNIKKN